MSQRHSESNGSTSRRAAFTLAVGLIALLDSMKSVAATRPTVNEKHKAGDATVISVDRESSISLSRNPCDRYVLASAPTSGTIVAAKCETPPPRRRPCYL